MKKARQIIQDVVDEHKVKILKISRKKQEVAKRIIDRIEKDKIQDLKRDLADK